MLTQYGRTTLFGGISGLDSMGAERGVTFSAPAADQAGNSIDGYDRDATGNPGMVVGAPRATNNGQSGSGSVYVVSADHAAPVAVASRAHSQCATGALHYRGDVYGSGSVPVCRLTPAKIVDQTINATKCPLKVRNSSEHARCAPGLPEGNGGRAKSLKIGKALNAPTAGSADAAAMTDGTYAWALLDSLNRPIGYVRPTLARDGAIVAQSGSDKKPLAVTMFDLNKNMIGRSGANEPRTLLRTEPNGTKDYRGRAAGFDAGATRVESSPCIAGTSSNSYAAQLSRARQTAIVYFAFDGGAASNDTGQSNDPGGRPISIRAIINRNAFKEHALSKRYTNNELLDHYFVPCKAKSFRGAGSLPAPTQKSYHAPKFAPPSGGADKLGDSYQGYESSVLGCGGLSSTDTNCGGSLRNFEFPTNDLADQSIPHFPDTVMVVGSTSGVRGKKVSSKLVPKGAGVARAILRVDPTVDVLDAFPYLDQNVPCDRATSVNWELIRVAPKIYGWVPRKANDDLSPGLPQPVRRQGAGDGC